MPHSPKDVARTAYSLYLLGRDMEVIRHIIVDIGLKVARSLETRIQLYNLLGEIERARGYETQAEDAFRQAASLDNEQN